MLSCFFRQKCLGGGREAKREVEGIPRAAPTDSLLQQAFRRVSAITDNQYKYLIWYLVTLFCNPNYFFVFILLYSSER